MAPIAPITCDLFRLAVYCSVIENHSFTRAAEELLLTQPAVSVHVRALERAFRAQLLDRSRRDVRPTEAGQAVYALAREVLVRTKETVDLVAELDVGSRGQLSLGASSGPGNYFLPAILAAFHALHTGARIRMRALTRGLIMDALVSGDVEFAYVEQGALPKGFTSEPMHTDNLVFFAAPQHRLAIMDRVTGQDLQNEEFALGVSGSSFAEVVDAQLKLASLAATPVLMEIGGSEAIKRIVSATRIVGLLPKHVINAEIERGELAELAVHEIDIKVAYELVYRPRLYRSPIALAFLDFLRGWPVSGGLVRSTLSVRSGEGASNYKREHMQQ